MTPQELRAAHSHCFGNKAEIERSSRCGCFFCFELFSPGDIEDWADDELLSAICPRCLMDTVLGDASGLPIDQPAFLSGLHGLYFGDVRKKSGLINKLVKRFSN